jgi:hypothetical protein
MIHSLQARPASLAFACAKGFVRSTITEKIARRHSLNRGRVAWWRQHFSGG